MRTEISIELRCSECGKVLECNYEKSKFEANSAFEAKSIISISPCQNCKDKAERPLKLFKEALSGIGNCI